jgi:hypothetical protein
MNTPEKITVSGGKLLIDGKEFPWPVALDEVSVVSKPGHRPAITVTIHANEVERASNGYISTFTKDASSGRRV